MNRGIVVFAFICSIMPFLCAYIWTDANSLMKLMNGLASAAIVFVFVFLVLHLVVWADSPSK